MQIEYQFFKHILPFNILTARFTSLTIFFLFFFIKIPYSLSKHRTPIKVKIYKNSIQTIFIEFRSIFVKISDTWSNFKIPFPKQTPTAPLCDY